jgi:hypothetical protein
MLVIGLLANDVIAEEPRWLCAGMRDECFGLREFEFEPCLEELCEVALDGLGLLPWTAKADQEVG